MDFDTAFSLLLGHEGGYVNMRADPGGETKYGISKRAYPGEDIKNLTEARAKTIYARDYWGPAGCDAMPDKAKLQVFDMAVNQGVKTAIKATQHAVGEYEDGVLGPLTLQALQSMPIDRFIARFNGARLLRYADDVNFPAFGRGWARRVGMNLLET